MLSSRRVQSLLLLFAYVTAASALLQYLDSMSIFHGSFGYTRASVEDYSIVWRWLTSSLVHLGWMHWWLNILNLAAIIVIFGKAWSVRRFIYMFAIVALGMTAGLYLFSPDVSDCAGMSGVLYGMALYGALRTLHEQVWISTIVLAYLGIKLFANSWIDHIMAVDKALDGIRVITDAHSYGAIMGLMLFIVGAINPSK